MLFKQYQCGEYSYVLCARCDQGFHGEGHPVGAGADIACERCHAEPLADTPLHPGDRVAARFVTQYHEDESAEYRWYTGTVLGVNPVGVSTITDYRYSVHCPDLYPAGSWGFRDPYATVNLYHSSGDLVVLRRAVIA
ncbi:MAG: hypothetical protein C7B46_21055 [Sulfobacillus benefaciens]|uniref:Uncharacterized protein n=1 Tax=Sulfobacillus benefaciens TaxID=453960 RepID=A0A2T2WQD0_9FIRM|nr:MAG: hypothetical protein C7B46_21055 [Sulfobacillus benefaciens]